MARMKMSDEQLKQKLTPQQYKVLRKKGTEAPFSGKFLYNKDKGMYVCAACGAQLFSSDTKFESGSGWPSFYDVFSSDAIRLNEDNSDGMKHVEAECAICGSHLGHVFNDAPQTPTGMRFCINSCALDFMPNKKAKAKKI